VARCDAVGATPPADPAWSDRPVRQFRVRQRRCRHRAVGCSDRRRGKEWSTARQSAGEPKRCSESRANHRFLSGGAQLRKGDAKADSLSLSGFRLRPREKPGVQPLCGPCRAAVVGRDAHSPATWRRVPVVSLSGCIPVPQCCRMRFAISAALAVRRSRLPRAKVHEERADSERCVITTFPK